MGFIVYVILIPSFVWVCCMWLAIHLIEQNNAEQQRLDDLGLKEWAQAREEE